MDFGIPTLIEWPDLERCVFKAARMGFQFVELNMNMPAYQLHRLDAARLIGLMEEHSIYFTIHLPEEMDLANPNPRVSAAYRDTVFEALELAARLRMPVLNMHLNPGIFFTLPGERRYLYSQDLEQYLDVMTRFREEYARRARGTGVRLLIENTGGFLPHQASAIECLLESPAFGLTLDVGHSFAALDVDLDFFKRHERALHHMHLHDASGKKNHLPIGEGDAPIAKYVELARDRGLRVVVEVKTEEALCRSVETLKERGLMKSMD